MTPPRVPSALMLRGAMLLAVVLAVVWVAAASALPRPPTLSAA